MKSTDKNVVGKFGKVSIPAEAFERKNIKHRVTAFVDLDVLDALKARAEQQGTKYQTLMNQILRDTLLGGTVDQKVKDMIRNIVKEELKKSAA